MPFSPAIEACRVPDERLAGAYEETSAAHRSWIKTTLALAEATYPAPPSRLTITSENAAAGFGFARTRETAGSASRPSAPPPRGPSRKQQPGAPFPPRAPRHAPLCYD